MKKSLFGVRGGRPGPKAATALVLAASMVLLTFTCAAGGGDVPDEEAGLPAAALVDSSIPCESAILIEQTTGQIFFEKNADQRMAPASITKVMTLLLVMEALDSGKIKLTDMVTCSPHANSMGGTQIWFEVGEQMTVDELLRATAIASANDAAVALGEFIAGSEESFVQLMNQRAAELGMTNTTFKNATGLDAEGHLTTARDIAVMSAELLRHPDITKYTTIWMDSLRDGKTQLVNTNKLVRFYEGTTGLKTGTTSDAGYCLSASATRNGLSLIAVVLGAKNSDNRFGSARGLLEFGFANYAAQPVPEPDPPLSPVKVLGGVRQEVPVEGRPPEVMILEKGAGKELKQTVEIASEVSAPVEAGQQVGTESQMRERVRVCAYDVVAADSVEKMTLFSAFDILWRETVRMG